MNRRSRIALLVSACVGLSPLRAHALVTVCSFKLQNEASQFYQVHLAPIEGAGGHSLFMPQFKVRMTEGSPDGPLRIVKYPSLKPFLNQMQSPERGEVPERRRLGREVYEFFYRAPSAAWTVYSALIYDGLFEEGSDEARSVAKILDAARPWKLASDVFSERLREKGREFRETGEYATVQASLEKAEGELRKAREAVEALSRARIMDLITEHREFENALSKLEEIFTPSGVLGDLSLSRLGADFEKLPANEKRRWVVRINNDLGMIRDLRKKRVSRAVDAQQIAAVSTRAAKIDPDGLTGRVEVQINALQERFVDDLRSALVQPQLR